MFSAVSSDPTPGVANGPPLALAAKLRMRENLAGGRPKRLEQPMSIASPRVDDLTEGPHAAQVHQTKAGTP